MHVDERERANQTAYMFLNIKFKSKMSVYTKYVQTCEKEIILKVT